MKQFGYAILLGIAAITLSCGGSSEAPAIDDNSGRSDEITIDRTVPPNPIEVPNEDGVIISHAISLRSEAKYPSDFDHFDYVNPDAPKGGMLVMAATGTFDSFHRYGQRGSSAPGSALFYDTLMTSSGDEVEVYYGLIAEYIEYSPEYDWIIFHIRPEARFQDGSAISANDVVFSFNKFLEEGVSQFRMYYEPVISVEALDDSQVKFTLSKGDKEMLISLGQLTILPPQFWADRDFSEPLTEPPLGSGAYVVDDYAMGEYVVWKRLDDYWGMDLAVNKGQLNFDFIRYDMYRDEVVQLEALKAGEIDLRLESSAKQWATQYTGPNFDAGYIITEGFPDEAPPPIRRYIYNIQRPIFSDRRVREALGYMMDFEWLNKNLFYNQYTRTRSYFQNTAFEALGLPSQDELEILEPIRDQIPEEVFTQEYNPHQTDGSGLIRGEIAAAQELLREAGWEIQDQVMVNVETGEPLEFELLIYSPTVERAAIPFQENLKKLGVTMNIRLVDTTQFINRLRERDFEMIFWADAGSFFPSSNLQIAWRSNFIDSSYNYSGVQDPAIDYLVDGIVANQNDNAALQHWGRAFDRVLQWNHYGIFNWYIAEDRVAYWDKFSRPEVKPKYSVGFGTWWYDEEKASRLPE